jgi:hypothetical protein
MVEKVTVTVYAQLTKYGEVEFSVNSHRGMFKRKCLHDALSDADIKMTGIEDIVNSFRRKLNQVEHFAIESKHTRLYDQATEAETTTGESSNDTEPAPEHSADNVSSKRGKSTKSRTRRKEAVLL